LNHTEEHCSLLCEGISPILLVVNFLPGNTQVNKENQLTKETVSVPVLLKVMYHIHVCDTFISHSLHIYLCF